MASIFGLLDTETFNAQRFTNYRRSVLYQYPTGASPLTALLSLAKEEATDDPKFNWHEDRMDELFSKLENISSTIVFYTVAITPSPLTGRAIGGTWVYTTAAANITPAVPTTSTNGRFGIKVADASKFRIGHIVEFEVTTVTPDTQRVCAIVENVDVTNNIIGLAFVTIPTANIDYDAATNANRMVTVVGQAVHEGSLNEGQSQYTIPYEIYNYTAITRKTVSATGTAGMTQVKFDKEGPTPDQQKKALVNLMNELELKLHFSDRSLLTVPNERPRRTTGGILFFLREWEKTSNNPYGATGATTDSDFNKRIIENTGGTMTMAKWNDYIMRAFYVTNNVANEKLCLCGNGFLNVINQLYQGQSVLNKVPKDQVYGMDFVEHVSPFGTLYYKTHPLYNQNPILRNCALIVDVNNLCYRYIEGRDMVYRDNIQPNDADWREDEWLTESGLEVHFPESMMYIKNVTSAA